MAPHGPRVARGYQRQRPTPGASRPIQATCVGGHPVLRDEFGTRAIDWQKDLQVILLHDEGSSGEYFEEDDRDGVTREASQVVAGWQVSPFKFVAPGNEERPHSGGDYVLRRASLWLNRVATYSLVNPPPLPSLTDFITDFMEDLVHLR